MYTWFCDSPHSLTHVYAISVSILAASEQNFDTVCNKRWIIYQLFTVFIALWYMQENKLVQIYSIAPCMSSLGQKNIICIIGPWTCINLKTCNELHQRFGFTQIQGPMIRQTYAAFLPDDDVVNYCLRDQSWTQLNLWGISHGHNSIWTILDELQNSSPCET